MPSENQIVAKNAAWNTIGSLFYLGSQWLLTIIVTRYSGLVASGILSLAISISATFQTVSNFGIRNYQVSDVNNKYPDTAYVGWRTLACVATLVLCFAFSLINGYKSEQLLAIMLFMVFRISESYSDVIHGIAQKNNRLDIAGKSLLLKGFLILIFFSVGYFPSFSLCLGIALMTVSSILVTVFFDIFTVRKICPFGLFYNVRQCFSLAKETLPLFVYQFLFSSLTTIPRLFLERMESGDSLGAYSSIFAIATLFQMVTGYIYAPFTHIFAKQYKEGNISSVLSSFLKIIGAFIVIAVITLICATLVGDYVLILLYKESISDFTHLLIPILISVFVLSLLGFIYMLEVVIRDFKGLLLGNAVAFIFCIVLTPIFITKLGTNGASYSLTAATLIAAAITVISLMLNLRRPKKHE